MATRKAGGRADINTRTNRPAPAPARIYDRPGGSRNRFARRDAAVSQTTPRTPNFGENYKEQELMLGAAAARAQGQMADLRGGGGMASPTVGILPTPAAEAAQTRRESGGSGPSQSESRKSATGVQQSGRNLGRINLTVEDMSSFAGVPVASFGGQYFGTPGSQVAKQENTLTAFPLTGDRPQFMGEVPGVPMAGYGQQQQAPLNFGESPDLGVSSADARKMAGQMPGSFWASNANIGKEAQTGERAGGPAAAAAGKTVNDAGSSRLNAALADTDSMVVAKDSTESQELARRAAFLGGGGALEGMKRVKAGLGYQTIGGEHVFSNNGKIERLSQEAEREIRNAPADQAQALKDAYIAKLAGRGSGSQSHTDGVETPANQQNPIAAPGSGADYGNVSFEKGASAESITGNRPKVGNKVNFNQPAPIPFGESPQLGIIETNTFKANNSVFGN